MGVFATATLAEGVSFGPVPAAITLTDPAVLIGHMTCDVRPNIHTVKVDILEYRHRLSEWTPYVQAARDNREQNLAAEVKGGHLYYRSMRTITPGDELLVWYSQEYARLLNIPPIQTCHVKECGRYCCSNCSQEFHFPNTLRAHMRFKCEGRHMTYKPAVMGVRSATSLAGRDFKSMVVDSSGYPYMVEREGCRQTSKCQSSPATSIDSTDSVDSSVRISVDTDSPRSRESPRSPEKRKLDNEDWSRDVKRTSLDKIESLHSQNCETDQTDFNQNVRRSSDAEDTGGSAFRKVEKQSTAFQRLGASPAVNIASHYNMAASRAGLAASFGQLYGAKSNMSADEKSSLAALASIYNRHPLALSSFIPNWNMAASMTDVNRNPLKVDVLKGDEKLSDIHNIENSNPHFKLATEYSSGRVGNILPYYRSQNPMVEKIIQSALHVGRPTTATTTTSSSMSLASLSVMQNWCAKCNASFRMTSDLVYHMRSHHSPEHDHVKKKREDKLKCTVCGETFRERHHLTRHMTSHQDM